MSLLLIPLLAAHLVVGVPVEVEIHYMAPGVKAWIPPPVNGWGRGFTLEEYKTLLTMDGDLYIARQQLKLVDDLKLNWNDLLEQKDAIIKTLREDKKILTTRSLRIEEKWNKCEEDLVEVSGGDYLPWVIAGVGAGIGIAGAGIALGVVLSK